MLRLLIALVFLFLASPVNAGISVTIIGGEAGAPPPADCSSGTYEIGYNGDHSSGANYICYESGGASEVATANTADVVSSSYVEYNAVDENLTFTITGDISAGLDSEGSVFFTVYSDTAIVGDGAAIEIRYDNANYIIVYVDSTAKLEGGANSENGTWQVTRGDVVMDANTWYRCGYTWQTGADAGGKHCVTCEASETALTAWDTVNNEDVEDLDDWTDTDPVDPAYFVIGENLGGTVAQKTRIKDVYVTTGYAAADPLP